MVKTNPDKYLLGVFPYGPNNQMRGFRDTILDLKLPHFKLSPYLLVYHISDEFVFYISRNLNPK